MAIEVRIPTILRTYTGGAKVVEGSGSTLGELIKNLEAALNGESSASVRAPASRRSANESTLLSLRTSALVSYQPPGRCGYQLQKSSPQNHFHKTPHAGNVPPAQPQRISRSFISPSGISWEQKWT